MVIFYEFDFTGKKNINIKFIQKPNKTGQLYLRDVRLVVVDRTIIIIIFICTVASVSLYTHLFRILVHIFFFLEDKRKFIMKKTVDKTCR